MGSGREAHISQRLASELATLFYYHPPWKLNRNLRKMFLDYVECGLTVGVPDYFEELAPELNWLFNFLDVAEEEVRYTDEKRTGPEQALKPGQPMNSLDAIVKHIVDMLAPERIYSLAYGDPLKIEDVTYYDLLIVMPDVSQKPFRSYETLIELCCFDNSHVNCSLHQSATLVNYINEGNLFYSSVCITDNLVYQNGADSFPDPDPERIAVARLEAKKVFTGSYNKATSFMDGAKFHFDKGGYDVSAFMLQQAAELTLRGVVMAFTGRDVRTHSVGELLKNCRRVAPQLHMILRGNGAESERLLELLEGAYLNSRYQEGYEVKAEDLEVLMKRVELLLVRAKEVFE